MGEKISVFCIWRDSEKSIHKTLKQLESLESLETFSFSFYFYENDSSDNTVEILSNWMSSRNGKILSENLGAKKFGSVEDPERMIFLCDTCQRLQSRQLFHCRRMRATQWLQVILRILD